ncbi:FmdB family transcriptional regulator [Nocardioides marmoriginsengisoli]|uniref:FmdB family transcriptional regulator n=1 Tax=Nocardioides marmoriginsengisoli TaxID=661483 RepID=A0A3N0CG35_9ACTN|nr:FmdB family zinc ribbon protein [Nocardioides marmoriginsengisoli]RNL62407.1 FmdB family transcriptional regulator [Nocardioides marmoriginsengisoli]
MPTYQYSCTDCGHFFEAVQSFSDDSLTVCPECDGKLRKVFNAVGVVFKGSGFYRNDSRGTTTSTSPAASPSESTPAPTKTESAAPASTAAASS